MQKLTFIIVTFVRIIDSVHEHCRKHITLLVCCVACIESLLSKYAH